MSRPQDCNTEARLGASVKGTRVYCSCGERAHINKTNNLSTNVADVYCSCPSCGHRFVMFRAFSHTLSPSALTTEALTMAIIRSVTPSVRRSLQQQLSLF
nr:ogr/Delta-like zinc finger family protein [Enterovibrio norvegicus]